MQTDHPETRL